MDKIKIITPEYIELEYDLAGLGSRFVAVAIDTLIQGGVIAVLFLALILGSPGVMSSGVESLFKSVFSAIITVLMFIVLFGYFIFFEVLWSGQTPGKKIAQIQVLRDNGEPVKFVDVLLRNLFRMIDFLPWYYIMGIALMLVNKQRKRLGDIIAKTIVVRLKSDLAPTVLPDLKIRTDLHIDVAKINEEEYSLIRSFIIRRDELKPQARAALAEKISLPLMKKLEVDPAGADFEELLEVIAVQYRERKTQL
jgi:uncharacterized RDD family membrane protein YckC